MTRLDIGKMNKDYVDPARYEKFNGSSLDSSFDSRGSTSLSSRPTALSLAAILDTLKEGDPNKIKSLLRHNDLPVNHEARAQLWTLLCCGSVDNIGEDATFQMYAEKFNNVAPETVLPIHDMTEEMKTHHILSEEGIKACHRVLYVISETHPHIQQFSPLLYAFTSVMLHYTSEQACFQCIDELLKRRDINYFLVPTELSLNAAPHVIKELAFRYAKSAATFISRNLPNNTEFCTFCNDWVLWIFKHLPFHYLVRIIDCYLVEGYKVLFRVALVLIKLFFKLSAKKQNAYDVTKAEAAMKLMCADISMHMSCDELLKEAFGIRGFSKKELDSLFSKTECALRGGSLIGSRSPRPSEANAEIADRQRNAGADKNKKLIAMRSKKSFRLDKGVHTQIILDDVSSEILDKSQLLQLWSWLPPAESVKTPCLTFTTNEDGYSLKTFYEKVEKAGPSLMIIRTMSGEIFGAYCSTDWVDRHKHFDTGAVISYFGNGMSFVYTIWPDLRVYNWVGKDHPVTPPSASMFQAGDRTMLMIGGGSGCALQMDKDLDYGSTSHCETFDNPPLVDNNQFRIQCLEVFTFMS